MYLFSKIVIGLSIFSNMPMYFPRNGSSVICCLSNCLQSLEYINFLLQVQWGDNLNHQNENKRRVSRKDIQKESTTTLKSFQAKACYHPFHKIPQKNYRTPNWTDFHLENKKEEAEEVKNFLEISKHDIKL